jgi:hypothetical protein
MSQSVPLHATLDDWMTREAIPFAAVLNSTTYNRGGPPLPPGDAGSRQ